MNSIRSRFSSISASFFFALALVAGCAPTDSSPEISDGPGAGEEEAVGEAAQALTSADLSTLLAGKALTVTQDYLPNGTHAGIDFGGVVDGVTPVSAPLNGTITANTTACGKIAIFDGSNTIILAHMTALTALPVGSSVTTGTYLGKASKVIGGGCSASGAHIHIEIRKGNNTSMALPSANNTATTLNPLSYQYGPFAAVSVTSPSAGASVAASPVAFSWAAIQGASTYRLQIAGSGGFSGDNCVGSCVFNNTTGATSLSVPLSSAGVYYWRVRAGSSYTGGAWSASRKLTKN